MDLKTFTQLPFYIKLACVLFSLFAIGCLVILGKEILSPLLFSCLFSILLLPLARFFELKMRLPRSAASMIAVVLFLSIVGLIIYVIGSQIADLLRDWPAFQAQISRSMYNFRGWVSEHFHITRRKQLNVVNTATSKVTAPDAAAVGTTLLSLSSMILFLVFTFIYTFFFLLYRKLIMKFLESVFLEENKAKVHEIIEQVQMIIRKYITGLLIEMAIVAIAVSVTLSILGVKYAILLGLITGIFNLIPYFGIFSSMVLSATVTLGTSQDSTVVIYVLIAFVITHLVDSNIVLPLVVGSKVRINALVTILGVVIGEMFWGVSGMFLSIPVIAVLKIIFDRVESLHPWGIILGDEEKKQNKLARRLTTRKKKVQTAEE
ncbi:AI-2E family transporter [Mucilaginibacter flavidus]|uniref:AI-2E family transporter n=1 Tax=Mucilaginibacter flavidus TaxID=2949309 RepID=UPI002091EFA0|nr:AI-2E family transporter [Mucilaginibacter flavidus]MCO5948105.1 AI-2E family transporter [Mucilaginibacter flavidus]